MFRVFRAKGNAGFNSRGCDERIGELNAVGKRMLFDEGRGHSADGLGKGQNPELELAKGLPDLAHFQL